MANTNPARGTRDFLPSDVRKREYVIGIIKEVYESYGFEPLETPSFENLETLTGKYGEEGNQLIFKILKRGEKLQQTVQPDAQGVESSKPRESGLEHGESQIDGEVHEHHGAHEHHDSHNDSETNIAKQEPLSLTDRQRESLADLALRYDLTVPLARVVAHHKNDLPKFFKRYQIQPVWRADRPAKGRYREFYQCDVDAIGSDSMVVEAEQISAVSEILKRLGFDDFVIRLNDRDVLYGLLKGFGIPEERLASAIVILDKLDKIGLDRVINELSQDGVVVPAIVEFIQSYNNTREALATTLYNQSKEPYEWDVIKDREKFLTAILDNLRTRIGGDSTGLAGLRRLEHLVNFCSSIAAYKNLVIDPFLARGLSYYTGAIMEINVPDLAGSLGGGGRYNGLIGMFGKEQIPACGFSLGLERIIVVMEERGMFPPEIAASTSADVMVTIWNEDSVAESLKLANELRAQKLRVLVYPEADKLGKQFKYAGQITVPYVCVIGESELAENKVTVKNMTTGEQETVARDAVAEKIST